MRVFMSLRRPAVWTTAGVLLALYAAPVQAVMPVGEYMSLRSRLCSQSLTLSTVKQDPAPFIGRSFELRGTVSGVAKNAAGTSVILQITDGDCQVLSASKDCNLISGSRICALVTVGENCTVSLSDLRLVGTASLGEVLDKERRDADARRETAQQKQYASKAITSVSKASQRTARTDAFSYRGTTEGIFAAYRKAVARFNSRLTPSEVDAITASILEFSRRENVDARLVMAVILAESHFNPEATSRCGAMGLGQLMPGTAKGLGVSNAYDPVANIAGAVRLIKGHLTKYSGSKDWNDVDWSHIQLALASYNAGPGAVKKYGGVPPYRETKNYITKVISYYKELCGIN